MSTFVLGEIGRILIACGGAVLVLVVAVLVICCLGKSCCIYKALHPAEATSELLKNAEARRRALYGAEVILADFPHNKEQLRHPKSTTMTSDYSSTKSGESSERSSAAAISLRDSIYSSSSANLDSDQIDLTSAHVIVEEEAQRGSMTGGGAHQHPHSHPYVSPPPQVTLNLQLTSVGDPATIRLFISVNDARFLPPRMYGSSGAADAFLTIKLTRSSVVVMEARTRTIRRATQPVFQETFQADIRRADLKDLSLEVRAHDHDRYANATDLCEGSVCLATMLDVLNSMTPQHLNLSMHNCNKVTGEILLSITLLPTAQKISFSVLRVQRLIEHDDLQGTLLIRIVMLLNSSGRSIKRKKTKVLDATNKTQAPSAAEPLTFDVIPDQLEAVTFLVTVCTHDDVCLGKVAVGKHVRGVAQKLHWDSVMENPRKVFTHWHTLH